MAGSAAKKKGMRARRVPRLDDISDNNCDAPFTQTHSPPCTAPQHLDGSSNRPSKKQKNIAEESSGEKTSVTDLPPEIPARDVSKLQLPNDKLDKQGKRNRANQAGRRSITCDSLEHYTKS
ncbi:hypothetical protein PC128_g6725 [Phytophthora cactorum]|nr:hypothetical protein PC128_g6725 [Phytophthora cactorum]